MAVGAIVFLLALVLASGAASLIAPYDPLAQDLSRVLSGPGSGHLLGTDTLGRDVLSRLLHGGQRSLVSIVEALGVVLAIGVPFGLIGGYVGGWTDRLLSRLSEIVLSIPAIILILVVLAVVPRNADAAMVAFGVLGAPAVLRVVRAATLKLREEPYVAAARVSGLSHARIIVRHVAPLVVGPIIVQASVFCAYALLFETGISYLGLTADPATPTWGGMVAEASTVLDQDRWLLVPSGSVIALTILACGLLGDAVRDAAAGGVVPAGGARPGAVALEELAVSETGRRDRMPRRADAILSVRGLSVALAAGGAEDTLVVDRADFDIGAGETVGLVGESGCGKSVMSLSLLRLLPSALRVTAGRVDWAGEDLLELTDREFDRLRGSTLGYISQEPQSSLDPAFAIGSQLVEVVRRHDGCSRAAAKARALDLLRMVEIPAPQRVARAHAHELSGGMAQRVCVALALAGRPRLLIADEPTTALDVTVQREILALLRGLQAETGMAMLIITHNWAVVAELCDRTLVMYAGQIIEEAQTRAMFDQPLHPYTRGLLDSHPSTAIPGERLAALAGQVPSPGSWPAACRFAPRCRFSQEECLSRPIAMRPLSSAPGRLSRCVRVEDIARQEAR